MIAKDFPFVKDLHRISCESFVIMEGGPAGAGAEHKNAGYARFAAHAKCARTECRTADITCRKAATLSPSGAARPAVSPPTAGLRRSDPADRRLLPGLISLPPSH
jgi:hypothetical protein